MQPTKSAEPVQPDVATEQEPGAAASPPARKPRKPKAVATEPDAPTATAPEAPVAAEPATETAAVADSSEPASEPAVVPAENLVRREDFARMIGYRPAELVSFERKGWLRPVAREEGVSLYNKAEAQEIRQDLRRRLQEEADQTRRNRRY